MNVLIIRLSALGDVAMTIPAVYSVARAYPQHCFHVVTSAFCAQLYVCPPENIVVHPVEKGTGTWQLLKLLNALPVDLVADLHNVLRSWIVDAWFLLKCKKVRMVDKRRSERKRILCRKQQTTRPMTLRYFDVFERLGLRCNPNFTSVFEQKPSLPFEREKGYERWIGIAPFARYANKIYPLDLMQQVVQLLVAQSGIRVFLFGSKGREADTMKRWEYLSSKICSVAGCFTLQQELSLMSHLDTMISMDSANMHLASLVGTRVVSIWGSTTPACGFLGYGQQERDAVCAHVSCQPCTISGSRHCHQGQLECLRCVRPAAITECITNLP